MHKIKKNEPNQSWIVSNNLIQFKEAGMVQKQMIMIKFFIIWPMQGIFALEMGVRNRKHFNIIPHHIIMLATL